MKKNLMIDKENAINSYIINLFKDYKKVYQSKNSTMSKISNLEILENILEENQEVENMLNNLYVEEKNDKYVSLQSLLNKRLNLRKNSKSTYDIKIDERLKNSILLNYKLHGLKKYDVSMEKSS